METTKEMLRRILSTELLGESVGKIASSIGLKTKSTLYRILDGSATEKTADKVLTMIENELYITEEEMRMLSVMLQKYEYFSNIMKAEKTVLSPEDVVVDIISRNYSRFSEEFNESAVSALEMVRQRDRTCFYNILFYYYVKKSCRTFYRKGMTHQERCMSLIIPLADALFNRYPEQIKSTVLIEVYNRPDQLYYTTYPHLLFKCIEMGHNVLAAFDTPQEFFITEDCIQLPFTQERSYWVNRDHSKVVFALFCSTERKRHGYYAMFSFDDQKKDIHLSGQLMAIDDFSVALRENPNVTHWGKGTLNDNNLWTIVWEDKDYDHLGLGDVWEMADLSKSESLTKFNNNLTDEKLYFTVLRDNGLELIDGYEISDVIISRFEVSILLESGKKLVADKSAYHFFDSLSPDFPVIIARNKSDGIEYVIWGDMTHMVPVSAFRVEENSADGKP